MATGGGALGNGALGLAPLGGSNTPIHALGAEDQWVQSSTATLHANTWFYANDSWVFQDSAGLGIKLGTGNTALGVGMLGSAPLGGNGPAFFPPQIATTRTISGALGWGGTGSAALGGPGWIPVTVIDQWVVSGTAPLHGPLIASDNWVYTDSTSFFFPTRAGSSGLLGLGALGASVLGGAGRFVPSSLDYWVTGGQAVLLTNVQIAPTFVGNGLVGRVFVGGQGLHKLITTDQWVWQDQANMGYQLTSFDQWVYTDSAALSTLVSTTSGAMFFAMQ
jgi:hypothetical protein